MIMTMITMLFACTTAIGNDSIQNTIRLRTVNAHFSKIVIRDDVNVVLIEDPSGEISMEGQAKWSEFLRFEVINGVLDVSCKKKGKKKLTVFIPVQKLEEIIVKGRSKVGSIGILNSARLHVRIEGDCLVNVVNWGTITVDNDPDHEFEYIKKQRIDIPGGQLK